MTRLVWFLLGLYLKNRFFHDKAKIRILFLPVAVKGCPDLAASLTIFIWENPK